MAVTKLSVRKSFAFVLAVFALVHPSVTWAQQLYSFETPDDPSTPTVDESLEGFQLCTFTNPPLNVGVSAEAASNGTHSLKIEKNSGYAWDAVVTINSADTVRYPIWNAVAHNLSGYSLDFDVIPNADSFSHVTFPSGGYMLMDVAVNSGNPAFPSFPNFPTQFNIAPPGNFANSSTTFHASVPMTGLPVVVDSGYYQLTIGSNSSSWPESTTGVRYYVDNIHFTALAPPKQTVSETIFSWETPDDSATPAVNEQFQGWTQGYQPGHTHSIVTSPAHGPTDGTHALNIHRVDLDNAPDNSSSAYFTWGSQYVLNSDPSQNGQIDNTVQQKISTLAGKINSASRVAFDVSFDPSMFDGSPTFAKFGLSFEDGTHSFQNEFPFFSPLNSTGPTTLTMDMPLTSFTQAGLNLGTTDLNTATHFFRIVMSTNVDGLFTGGASTPIDFQVDNFRLITEISGAKGDYNNDGRVDAADYVVWRQHLGQSYQLFNEDTSTTPGSVSVEDYAVWRANFGTVAAGSGSGLAGQTAVPEPSALALLLTALSAYCGVFQRKS